MCAEPQPITPEPITSLRALHELTNAQASQRLPVAVTAIVTYHRKHGVVTFVQDGATAIYVHTPAEIDLTVGDKILVRGSTRGSFRPIVVADQISVLDRGAVPSPAPANFDDLIRAKYDCRLVALRGIVHSADLVPASPGSSRTTTVQILTDGGYVEAVIDSDGGDLLQSLLDAEVEVVGVSAGKFDGKMQQTGTMLHVSSLADVKILKPAGKSPQSLPITPMDQILTGYHVHDLTQRIRVRGSITYVQPGSAIVLQNGDRSLWIMTRTMDSMRVGDLADATGFPDVRDGHLTLTRAEVQDTHIFSPIAPQAATWDQMTLRHNDLRDHAFDLVSIEGTVIMELREALQDKYLLVSDEIGRTHV